MIVKIIPRILNSLVGFAILGLGMFVGYLQWGVEGTQTLLALLAGAIAGAGIGYLAIRKSQGGVRK